MVAKGFLEAGMGRELPQMVEYIHVIIHRETTHGTRNTVQPKPTYINTFSVSFQQPTEIMEEATQTFTKPASVGGRYEDITTNLRSEFLCWSSVNTSVDARHRQSRPYVILYTPYASHPLYEEDIINKFS